MSIILRAGRTAAASITAVVFVSWLVGCGGGGGGGNQGGVQFGRAYKFTSGGQVFTLTVDSGGRFTLFAVDAASLAAGSGAQGNLGATGQFNLQSPDGVVHFSGQESADGGSVSGLVQRGGQTLFNFNAPMVAAGQNTAALSGTYFYATGASAAYCTVGTTGHATLWLNLTGASGGALVNISSSGAITTDDGSTVGQLTNNGGSYNLVLSKLNGQAVNVNIVLTKTSRAKWTVMVYMNAANNLQPFGPLNVNQMEEVGSTTDVNIVLQWKQASCASCGSPDWVGTRRYFITKDADTSVVHSQLVQDLGNGIDMGSHQTLNSFVTWAQSQYPADHYALVIWNHGAGWEIRRSPSRFKPFSRSVSIDDTVKSGIEIWELPNALNVQPKLDMIIFDASLMQMIEVAYELRNTTSVMVGSEESPPGEGYVYNTFLAELAAAPTMTASDFGKRIVADTFKDYGHNNNQTQSALDLSKMETVAQAVNSFALTLDAHKGDIGSTASAVRNDAQNYAYFEYKDLVDYANRIKAGTTASDLQQAATGVGTALSAALLAEDHGNMASGSHGLSIYVPAPLEYLSTYTNLEFARKFNWAKWLQEQPQ